MITAGKFYAEFPFSTNRSGGRKSFVRLFFTCISAFFLILFLQGCDISLMDYFLEIPNKVMVENDDSGDDDETGNSPMNYVYVAPDSGSDDYDGSLEHPVKTIGKALDLWAAETESYTKAGIMLIESIPSTYTEQDNNSIVDFQTLLAPAKLRTGVHDIVLQGQGTGISITAAGSRRVININNQGLTVYIKNLTVTGGTLSPGAGAYIRNGTLILEDGAAITGNEINVSNGKGGGIYVGEGGILIMNGGSIKDNKSGNDGGGLYIAGTNANPGKASIYNGTIENNTARYGGGIYVQQYAELTLGKADAPDSIGIDNSPLINHNKATGIATSGGGGILINSGITSNPSGSEAMVIFYHGTVSANSADFLGGGILVSDGTLDMRGGKVTGNSNTVNGTGTGPGIVLESKNNAQAIFSMSKRARVLDPDNPVTFQKLAGTNLRKITISGEFTGDWSSGIANIEFDEPDNYKGKVVLDEAAGSTELVKKYHDAFKPAGSGSSIDEHGYFSYQYQ
jgi:predicted outer membrane repeat protein